MKELENKIKAKYNGLDIEGRISSTFYTFSKGIVKGSFNLHLFLQMNGFIDGVDYKCHQDIITKLSDKVIR